MCDGQMADLDAKNALRAQTGHGTGEKQARMRRKWDEFRRQEHGTGQNAIVFFLAEHIRLHGVATDFDGVNIRE
jgi:hypothetical protein